MTEKQRECISELQILLLAINEIVKKHELEDEFISCISLGFIDIDGAEVDDDGEHRANMSLLSTFSVNDEEELDDLLSYCVEAYRMDQEEEENNPSNIDYWINLSKGDDSVN